MISEPSQQDRSTAQFAVGLWIWTIVVTVGSGIAFGSALDTGGGWAFGAMVGAFSTIPFWVIFSLGKHVLRNVIALRSDLWRTSVAEAPPPKNAATSSAPRDVLAMLLNDPAVLAGATQVRRDYGQARAAEYLTRQAAVAGYPATIITKADLPPSL